VVLRTLYPILYHHLLLLSVYHSGTASLPHSLRPDLFSFYDMGDQLGSTHCRVLFGSALQAYETDTGLKLAEHPLAMQLQSCRSIESIVTLLQQHARAFGDFRGYDRIRELIERTVSILFTLSRTGVLGASIGLVRQIMLIRRFRYQV
jgi:hypothetical protein